ncbi:MAG TPA: MdtA/MuxA family multidrug efflux RND transporter periplasmic adaptor subunit [Alphaproteobacteria bacterium]|nr:MdtA/MuxA family multidrug efflux RND transporter periplasmic adaptor subunit [Alphaproteobacteria bacterium]
MPSRTRRVILILGGLVVAALLTWTLWPQPASKRQGGRFGLNGPMPVVEAAVTKGDMPVVINALGTVTPLATVTVKTQINGRITEIGFKEGQMVKAGDFLAQIDPRPYQIALEQAQAQFLHDQALLNGAEVDLERYRRLSKQDSIAKQQLDDQEYLVRQYQGTVASDQAQIDNAKLNLAYCHIVAPVSGRVGLRQVDQGNYVQTSDANGIVVITQMQPISVIFSVPEDELPAILKRFNSGAKLAVTAFDRSGTVKLATGTLAAIDNEISTSTGTVNMRAEFDNADEALFPNQFVNVALLVDTLKDTELVPSSAIQRGAPGTFVFVVKPDRTVAVQTVKLGPSTADKVAVLSGLAAGTEVVIDGADKLKEGAKVALHSESGPAPGSGKSGAAAPGGKRPGPGSPGSGSPGSGKPSSGSPGGGKPGGGAHPGGSERPQNGGTQPPRNAP